MMENQRRQIYGKLIQSRKANIPQRFYEGSKSVKESEKEIVTDSSVQTSNTSQKVIVPPPKDFSKIISPPKSQVSEKVTSPSSPVKEVPIPKPQVSEKVASPSIPMKEEETSSIPEKVASPSIPEKVTTPLIPEEFIVKSEEEQAKSLKKEKRIKLVVLDIDGLLVERQHNANIKHYNSEEYDQGTDNSFTIPNFKITPRDDLDKFWDVLFGLSNDDVSFFFAIWSSSFKHTFELVLKKIIPEKYYPHKFLFVWDRNMCELDPDFGQDSKVLPHSSIKRVETIVNSCTANKLRKWRCDVNHQNILIVDNDVSKLRFNHPNTQLVFTEFDQNIMNIFNNSFFELHVI